MTTTEVDYRCPNCQTSEAVYEQECLDHLEFGVPEQVTLLVRQPVLTCRNCKERWTDWRGEDARTEAVERYKRVLLKDARAEQEYAEGLLRQCRAMFNTLRNDEELDMIKVRDWLQSVHGYFSSKPNKDLQLKYSTEHFMVVLQKGYLGAETDGDPRVVAAWWGWKAARGENE